MRNFLTSRWLRLSFATVVALTFAAVACGSVRASTPQLTWLDRTQDVQVSNGNTIDARTYDTLENTGAGVYTRLTCTTGSLQVGDCWYETSAGKIAQAGQQVQLHGMDAPGYIVDTAPDPTDPDGYSPHPQSVIPTPENDAFLQLVQDATTGRYHVYFRTIDTMAVHAVPNPWGAPFYMFDTTDVPELTGTVEWDTIYNDVTYSAGGNQMAWYDASGFVTLVDLQTLAVRTVQVADQPYDGSAAFARIAPSDDGSYLAVSIAGGNLAVYDLRNCTGDT